MTDTTNSELKASISARYVPMAALFAAKDDIRYYLNGINVSRAPDNLGGIYVVGCNGHVLCVIHDREGTLEGGDSVTFRMTPGLLSGCKAKSTYSQKVLICGERVTVAPDFDSIGSNAEAYVMPGKALVEGKFPVFSKVIPNFSKLQPGMMCTVKAEYLALFDKVAGKTNRFGGVHFWHERPDGAVIAQIDSIPEFLGVIMPMRSDPDRKALEKFPCKSADA